MTTQDQHQVPYSFQFQHNVFKAAKNGNLTILKGFLDDKPKEEVLRLLSFKTKGVTPLIISCLGTGDPDRNHVLGIWEVVDYLVNKCGASIEQTGSIKFNGEIIEGAPPLWCAVSAGHLYIVKLLVESGANVNSANSMGQKLCKGFCAAPFHLLTLSAELCSGLCTDFTRFPQLSTANTMR